MLAFESVGSQAATSRVYAFVPFESVAEVVLLEPQNAYAAQLKMNRLPTFPRLLAAMTPAHGRNPLEEHKGAIYLEGEPSVMFARWGIFFLPSDLGPPGSRLFVACVAMAGKEPPIEFPHRKDYAVETIAVREGPFLENDDTAQPWGLVFVVSADAHRKGAAAAAAAAAWVEGVWRDVDDALLLARPRVGLLSPFGQWDSHTSTWPSCLWNEERQVRTMLYEDTSTETDS